jgi:methyl-accepting chemotaxis protein
MKKKQSGVSVYLMQVAFALVPLIVGAVILTYLAVKEINASLVEGVYNSLEVAAEGAARYFEYDIHEGIISQDDESFAYCDAFKKNKVEVTIFKDNIRFITSLKNDIG